VLLDKLVLPEKGSLIRQYPKKASAEGSGLKENIFLPFTLYLTPYALRLSKIPVYRSAFS